MKSQLFSRTVLTILIFAVFFGMQQCFAQKDSVNVDNEQMDEDRTVYWFYVNLRIVKDKETEIEKYVITRLGSQIFKGTIAKYDHDLWQNLGGGNKMAIGPFNDIEEAKQAYTFYDFNKKERQLDPMVNPNKEVFYFVLRVEKRPRSGAYLLKRIPGAIASGTTKEFDDLLVDGLTQNRLSVGPFWSHPEAEEAKRMYRLAGNDN